MLEALRLRAFPALGNMPDMPARHSVSLRLARVAGLAVVATHSAGCGVLAQFGLGDEAAASAPREAIPLPDPGFPAGYRRWPSADAVVDEQAGTVHRLYRAPDTAADRRGRFPNGAVLIKEHVVPGEDDLVVRIDVRRKRPGGTYGGWEYESFDAATHKRLEADAEACDLCHQTAPSDGTFTRFAGR